MLPDLRLGSKRDQALPLPITDSTQLVPQTGRIEFSPNNLLGMTSILDLGLMNRGGISDADPLGLNLFSANFCIPCVEFDTGGRVNDTLAFRGSENDHVPPERQTMSNMSLGGSLFVTIPDDYDLLADRVTTVSTAQATSAASTEQTILDALLKGLGLSRLEMTCSGPELAEQVGFLLRESTIGTVSSKLSGCFKNPEGAIDMSLISSHE